MLAIALVVLTQFEPAGVSLNGPIFPSPKGISRAFFEFAPLDGAGMGAACAGTTPTGAKGEAMTFARASTATCIKGNTTSLANGDMVVMSSSQPRVMPGGNGTGGLGILLEGGTTNTTARSEQIDNALWVKVGTGVAAPVVTPNIGVSPTGLTEADQVVFAAANAEQNSALYQAGACPVGTSTASVWLKGESGSGTIQLIINVGTSGACTVCNFNSTTWTRCSVTGTVVSLGNYIISNHAGTGYSCSAPPLAQQSVYVWGTQCEAGSVATSYVPAITAAMARAAEAAPTSILQFAASPKGSAAVTLNQQSVVSGGGGFLALETASSWDVILANDPNVYNRLYIGGSAMLTGPVVPAASTHRLASFWGGGTVGNILDGTSNIVIASPTTGSIETLRLGSYRFSAVPVVAGVYKQVCVDLDPTRCR